MTDTTDVEVERHPWNTSFDWVDQVRPPTTLTPEQVGAFDARGYVVVPELIDAATVVAVRDEIDGFEAEVDARLRQGSGRSSIAETGAITFATHLVSRSGRLRELSRHPTVVGICADLIGPDVHLYWDQAVYKKPEKPRRFPWHQDSPPRESPPTTRPASTRSCVGASPPEQPGFCAH